MKQQVLKGIDDDTIFNNLKVPYVSDAVLQLTIQQTKLNKESFEKEKGKVSMGIIIGPVLIAIGIILTTNTDRIWYGLIVVGLIFTVQGVAALFQKM